MHKPLLIGILICSTALAQTKPTTQSSTRPATVPVAEKLSHTDHELRIGDTTLKYKATAGTLTMKDEAGKPRANFFFAAYEKADAGEIEKRPITFVFNGGPGAAAIWLHLGTAGPKKVALNEEGYPGKPPHKLVDNPSTWLVQTDLVFIDPVGTGYSRPAEGVKGEDFYGVQNDIDSVSEFIRLYLTRSGRWASPKFVAGESYGTTRASMLSEHLLDRFGIALNGVILISTVLNFQTLNPSDGNELPYALFFPTYTAAAYYHKKLNSDLQNMELPKLLKEVENWVTEQYIPAMARGATLNTDQRKAIVSTMARYSGVSEPVIEKNNLRVSPAEFEKALLLDQRKVIGRFDGRITGEAMDLSNNYPEHDPSLSRYVGIYSGTFNDYVRRTLKFESDLPYEFLSGRVRPWDMGRAGNGFLDVANNLRGAMVKNPDLKVMVASGWYDLATPFFAADYTVSHMDMSETLRKNIRQTYYEGGHMMYHHQPSQEKLNKDIREFMEWAR